MSQDDPLNRTFNLDPENLEDHENERGPSFPYPDVPDYLTLDDISFMAVHSYKRQLEDIDQIPARYRQRALEVAKDYLNVAKDAVAKRDDNEIKKDAKSINTNNRNNNGKSLEDGSSDALESHTDRQELYRRLGRDNNETQGNHNGGSGE